MPYDSSPERDERQVVADYVFDYHRRRLHGHEHLADLIAIQRLKDSKMTERALARFQSDTDAGAWSAALRCLLGSDAVAPCEVPVDAFFARWATFRRRAAERVLAEHEGEIEVARCPECDRVLNSPRARQCFVCGHDWH